VVVGYDPGRRHVADAELVAQSRAGDKTAFAELMRRHADSVRVVCQKLLGDAEASKDALQEATLAAWLNLGQLADPERFGSWLSGIALNVARQMIRASVTRRRRDEVFGSDHERPGSPEEQVELADLARRVRSAVDALPVGQRDAVYLFYLAGLTHKEAAAELEVSVDAVKARLHHARARLSRSLDDLRPKEPTVVTSTDFEEMRIVDVRTNDSGQEPRWGLVLLETVGGDRHLPIFIGLPEAAALAFSLENEEMPRPMSYQFAASLLEACQGEVVEVRIDKLVESTYFATVVVETSSGTHEADARPSDALNLAALTGAHITANASLLQEPGDMSWWNDLRGRATMVQEVRARQREALEALVRSHVGRSADRSRSSGQQ
jgi:RNA polymerase sigma factor (sigma-70 family)